MSNDNVLKYKQFALIWTVQFRHYSEYLKREMEKGSFETSFVLTRKLIRALISLSIVSLLFVVSHPG